MSLARVLSEAMREQELFGRIVYEGVFPPEDERFPKWDELDVIEQGCYVLGVQTLLNHLIKHDRLRALLTPEQREMVKRDNPLWSAAMSNVRIDKGDGYAYVSFEDRQIPNESGVLRETPWKYAGTGKEECVLDLYVGQEVLKLAQSDVQELLPYLERFAKTGRLLEEQAR